MLAEDCLPDLRTTRRSRHFEQMSDADVMRQIAQEHGLSADIEVGSAHTVLAQVNHRTSPSCANVRGRRASSLGRRHALARRAPE